MHLVLYVIFYCIFSLLHYFYDIGAYLLDLLETVEKKLGTVDVRYLGHAGNIFKDLRAFHELIDQEANVEKISVIMGKRISMLEEILASPFNSELSKPFEKDDKSPAKKKRVFIKTTPLKNNVEKIKCQFCSTELKSKRTYKKHLREKHSQESVDLSTIQDEVKATCYMKNKDGSICRAKYPLNQIYRHLTETHKIEKKPKKSEHLRGWFSDNFGEDFTPVFLQGGEEDPVYDEEIIEENDINNKEEAQENHDSMDEQLQSKEKAEEDLMEILSQERIFINATFLKR